MGGPGSGYFGHAGRPGLVGGSSGDGSGGGAAGGPTKAGVIKSKKTQEELTAEAHKTADEIDTLIAELAAEAQKKAEELAEKEAEAHALADELDKEIAKLEAQQLKEAQEAFEADEEAQEEFAAEEQAEKEAQEEAEKETEKEAQEEEEEAPVTLQNVSDWIAQAQALGAKDLVEQLQAFEEAPTDTNAENAQYIAEQIKKLQLKKQ